MSDDSLASVFAELKVSLGSVSEQVKRSREQARWAARAMQPVFAQTMDNVVPVNNFGVVRLQGPDQGHFWYVRRIIVGGLTPTSTVAGRADVFASASDHRNRTSLAQFNITDWRDFSAALPNIAVYGRGALPLRFNEELYVVFSGASTATQYVAMCQFEDFEESAARMAWAE